MRSCYLQAQNVQYISMMVICICAKGFLTQWSFVVFFSSNKRSLYHINRLHRLNSSSMKLKLLKIRNVWICGLWRFFFSLFCGHTVNIDFFMCQYPILLSMRHSFRVFIYGSRKVFLREAPLDLWVFWINEFFVPPSLFYHYYYFICTLHIAWPKGIHNMVIIVLLLHIMHWWTHKTFNFSIKI